MSPLRVLSSSVAWLPWGTAPFARARDEGKPILLSIAATWSEGSRDMDRTSYADPDIATLINESFVPIRVDADERPDISERYGLGGWPTTAFLDPRGALLGGGTHVSMAEMKRTLERVVRVYDPQRASGVTVSPGVATHADAGVARPTLTNVTAAVMSSFDAEHGGFGGAPKFPLVAPLRLVLHLWKETREPRYRDMAVTSLDAMGWGGLYDEAQGGFFRGAAGPGWSQPFDAKLLDTNAELIALYLDAGAQLGIARFTDRAADALRYVQTSLSVAEGGWHASPAHAGGLQLVDAAAAMVSAALQASARFDDEGLRQFALTSLERLLLSAYRPGDGVAHVFDGRARVRGLLADQAAMVRANLDAYDATGNIVYEMMAEELARYSLRVMWDADDGGFFDAVEDAEAVGLMRERLKPFVLNCDLAPSLIRLAHVSGDDVFRVRAGETLDAMAPRALEHGPLAAHWVLALPAPGWR